jgi:hypothetical protein
MKVGDEITISGRMIHTETTEIIASGTVKFKKLKQLEAHLEELAYLLSGYSEKEVKKLLTNREIAKTRLGGRIASGLYFNNSADIFSFKPFTGSLFFHSRFIDADLLMTAPFPPARAGGFTGIVHLNPFIHFGIGAAFTRVIDAAGGTISGVKYKEAGWDGIAVGLNYRATKRMRAGLYVGQAISGFIGPTDADYYNYKLGDEQGEGHMILLNGEFNITDKLSLRVDLIAATGSIYNETNDPQRLECEIILIPISLGYSFSY